MDTGLDFSFEPSIIDINEKKRRSEKAREWIFFY